MSLLNHPPTHRNGTVLEIADRACVNPAEPRDEHKTLLTDIRGSLKWNFPVGALMLITTMRVLLLSGPCLIQQKLQLGYRSIFLHPGVRPSLVGWYGGKAGDLLIPSPGGKICLACLTHLHKYSLPFASVTLLWAVHHLRLSR